MPTSLAHVLGGRACGIRILFRHAFDAGGGAGRGRTPRTPAAHSARSSNSSNRSSTRSTRDWTTRSTDRTRTYTRRRSTAVLPDRDQAWSVAHYTRAVRFESHSAISRCADRDSYAGCDQARLERITGFNMVCSYVMCCASHSNVVFSF